VKSTAPSAALRWKTRSTASRDLGGVRDKVALHAASVDSFASILNVVAEVEPGECYRLAAQVSSATLSTTNFRHSIPTSTAPISFWARCANSRRTAGSTLPDRVRFRKVAEVPQTEQTPFHPRSAYGISKVAGYELTRNYREAHHAFAVSGILFNHESPRRGFEFVTRKITSGIARVLAGKANCLPLGNPEAQRDWGHAREYGERCGACYSRTNRTTMWSSRKRRTPSGNSAKWHLAK